MKLFEDLQFEDLHIEGEKHYKLRAECFPDVVALINKMRKNVWGIKIEQWGPMPDVDFEFKSRLTKDEIIGILRKQVDSHVMMDTLEPFDQYTGDRKFQHYPDCFGPQNSPIKE